MPRSQVKQQEGGSLVEKGHAGWRELHHKRRKWARWRATPRVRWASSGTRRRGQSCAAYAGGAEPGAAHPRAVGGGKAASDGRRWSGIRVPQRDLGAWNAGGRCGRCGCARGRQHGRSREGCGQGAGVCRGWADGGDGLGQTGWWENGGGGRGEQGRVARG
eukprot:scaffold8443_cov157-Isochrysis_galbana.AAC.1